MAVFTNFDEIPLFRYGMIMADPPWLFKNWSKAGEGKNSNAHYSCMSIEQIKKLRVGELAERDCILWLWATNPMLPQALEVMAAWGFEFKTAGHWVKRTKHGKLAFGTGYCLRSAGEPFLIGTIGKPQFSRSVRSIVDAPIREHSRKPDLAFDMAQKLALGTNHRIEIFSREQRAGWDVFGDEIDVFSGQGKGAA